MIALFKHLREQGLLLPYIGFLIKRHRDKFAYIFLTLAIIFALEASNRSQIRAIERTVEARCERTNEFRRNSNVQFQHFVDHNEAAVVLFRNVGELLSEQAKGKDFKALGREFSAASDYYAELSRHFRDVPMEDCSKVAVPPEAG